ncbi:MAG TPA: DNA modification methylase [Pseudolysinimonas sp.]|nr:DNA modification methylase [Pseudolysinimonas sp.]
MKLRAAAAAALAALVILGVAACAPIASLKPYDPSDGVSTKVGQVKVLNALVLSKSGTDGNLMFSAYNPTSELIQLNVQYGAGADRTTEHATLQPDATTNFGYGEQGQFLLTGIDVKPGSLAHIYFQYGNEEGSQLAVPVLDGSLPQYQNLLPTPTPTPTPTLTPTATPTPH